ncbi:hypothetical protein SOJ46_26390 [Pseudomonas aeruginosa]|nr:hypothetical protein [Pseudomonas aeruginosa]MCT5438810.1 hypothetical protein [Pseudomonas aeruginosa]MCT5580489.1 hypothetical protein [Pseudomonas aeruginosa]MDI4164261.1 hypothetical protein [Pseudomonas aeruginosa]MDY1535117.1 hypothetical protein [Pseudomonas aeruginosa]
MELHPVHAAGGWNRGQRHGHRSGGQHQRPGQHHRRWRGADHADRQPEQRQQPQRHCGTG